MAETTTQAPFLAAAFWDGTHPLSNLQEDLTEKLVPAFGDAMTPHGELLRCMSNLYYDVYNNGYCNREVLFGELDKLAEFKPQLLPLLQTKDSWKRGLDSILKDVAASDEEELCAEAFMLEDIVTAVVKYAAQQEGVALPMG